MGVSGIQQFKSAMSDAQTSIKTLDAALKLNEKSLKAGANAEKTMEASATLLNAKMKEQKKIADNATAALKKMDQDGVEPTSKAYQEMQRRLIEAQSAMMDTQDALNNMGQAAVDTAGKTNKVESSLNGISKKVSFDAVIKGIESMTSGLEKVAQKAVQVGENIWNNIVNSAKWADDMTTLAQMYEIPLEKLLQMEALVASGLDTSVDAIVGSMNKMKKNVGGGATATMEALKSLGLVVTEHGGKIEEGFDRLVTEDAEDLFWQAGKAIMAMDEALDKEATAQAIFGKSWRELIPLFTQFEDKESFNTALESMNTNSEEAVENLADLYDKLGDLEYKFNVLKKEILSGLAPALTSAAEVLSGLLEKLSDYLESDEGQEMLKSMGDAVSALFEDLSNIDPNQVVDNFVSMFDKLKDAFSWIKDNWGSVKIALEAIVGVWAVGKVASGITKTLALVNGIKGLTAVSAAEAGAAAGASWGSAFAGAVMAAAPWLIGLYTLLNPADTDAGELTPEQQQEQANNQAWLDQLESAMGGAEEYGKITPGAAAKIHEMYSYGKTPEQAANYLKAEYGIGTGDENWSIIPESTGPSVEIKRTKKRVFDYSQEEEPVEIEMEPVMPENAAELIQEQVGTVYIPAELVVNHEEDGEHANGLWSVPFDGYRAILHKGERVVPAREVNSSRNFSSNLYVESMYMNNGTDADGLAAAMAAAQRRTLSGYGS